SSMFNALTGTGVVTANYPGKTVEINAATARLDDLTIGLVDLPGTYALGAVSEDQWVARQGILDGKPDVVIVILDATNLARNLYMLIQLLDMGYPVVASLNLYDQARKKGLAIDAGKLSSILGVPIIPTVATRGEGLRTLMEAAVSAARAVKQGSGVAGRAAPPRYAKDVEDAVVCLEHEVAAVSDVRWPVVGSRGISILLLENDTQFVRLARESDSADRIRSAVARASDLIRTKDGDIGMRIIGERHRLAASIAKEVSSSGGQKELLSQRLWRLTTAPLTGIPILVGTLVAVFAFLFVVGDLLARGFSSLWAATLSPLIQAGIHAIAGNGVIAKILIWGPDAGIEAALAVGIPYVLTFYFLLAFLEDSGYLNSVAFLTDSLMHKFGLHGRSIIPLVAGAGCNVPAIIGTRVLTSRRERTIASTLICLVPCSARTAVILGAVGGLVGWQWGVGVFLILGVVIFFAGLGLNKVMPGTSSGLVMEMFPFRMPSLKTVGIKTWQRFKDFIFVALPIVLGGSLLLGTLYETGWMWKLTIPLKPLMEGWLGLPAVAGLTLIFAVLRKELALQLLVTLAIVQYGAGASNLLSFMNPRQLFVYALVNAIYIPCIATISALGKELGWKRAAGITAFTISLSLVVGGGANWALKALGM
ncbi:MAG TPA: ferrous iron transport protein B, partial [Spirochaetia bacterium]